MTNDPRRHPQLQFTEAELTPKLKQHVRRADQAAKKVEKAEKKIPKDRKKVKRRMIDQQTGKAKKKLYFEDVDRPAPASKLTHTVKTAPSPGPSTGRSPGMRTITWVWRVCISWKNFPRPVCGWRRTPAAPGS